MLHVDDCIRSVVDPLCQTCVPVLRLLVVPAKFYGGRGAFEVVEPKTYLIFRVKQHAIGVVGVYPLVIPTENVNAVQDHRLSNSWRDPQLIVLDIQCDVVPLERGLEVTCRRRRLKGHFEVAKQKPHHNRAHDPGYELMHVKRVRNTNAQGELEDNQDNPKKNIAQQRGHERPTDQIIHRRFAHLRSTDGAIDGRAAALQIPTMIKQHLARPDLCTLARRSSGALVHCRCPNHPTHSRHAADE